MSAVPTVRRSRYGYLANYEMSLPNTWITMCSSVDRWRPTLRWAERTASRLAREAQP